jgi:acyl-ACP thioesterase
MVHGILTAEMMKNMKNYSTKGYSMENVYKEARRITYYDLDCRGKLKLSALLRMVHIAADINARELGVGFTDLAPLNISFVLQRFGLGISRMPVYDENTLIRTWPASIERGAFFRKGDMLGEDGEKIMEWSSMWVLFDIAARKILRPNALPVTLTGLGSRGVEIEAERVAGPPDAGEAVSHYRHTVRYSEVDTNMHMNNSIYGDLINNALYMEEASSPRGEWKKVQINYLAETRLGDGIDVTCRKNEDAYRVTGKTGERASFAAAVWV